MIQIFYAVIRAVLKSRPDLNADTLQYIQSLEVVAKKSVLLWAVVRSGNPKAIEKVADVLHEALKQVDFMNE